jgi:hypothetical protein
MGVDSGRDERPHRVCSAGTITRSNQYRETLLTELPRRFETDSFVSSSDERNLLHVPPMLSLGIHDLAENSFGQSTAAG